VDDGFRIRAADAGLSDVEGLADVLIDCVEGGASVSFMAPLPRDKAVAFWRHALDGAGRGERIVLVAEDRRTGRMVGTVQVVLAMPDNQPHRAEVAKMLVHRDARRRGLGAALMWAAEVAARAAGRTLLVLDTATGGNAERLYARLGWRRCGVIPGFALLPHGGLCGTTVFYRELAGGEADAEPSIAPDPRRLNGSGGI
jgi:GNAT superfamily N-acetyltransferase